MGLQRIFINPKPSIPEKGGNERIQASIDQWVKAGGKIQVLESCKCTAPAGKFNDMQTTEQ